MTAISHAFLHHPALWRGNECATVAVPSVPTGFAELDVLLPGRGWPRETLTEIYTERYGIGELRLMMPALACLTRDQQWIGMIAPPYIPYAPALAGHGIRLSHVLLIQPDATESRGWAAEQILRSSHCGAALIWLNRVPESALRRLQRAAEGSGALLILFRTTGTVPFSSTALRLHVGQARGRTVVRILKRRGGGIPAPVALDLYGLGHFPLSRPPSLQTSILQAAF